MTRMMLVALLMSGLAGAAELVETESRELAPLQCWWRTDRVAIQVGQQLKLTVTCAAAETAEAKVIPDWDPMQPETVDLAPFEIVAGTRSDDVVVGPWRYTQFDYTLRLTAEEFFGQDVPLPSLDIIYSIAVNGPSGTIQQGRERTYVLPPLPIKVLSLVPGLADDIEEVAAPSFATIERRHSQAAKAFVIGCGLLAAGALCVIAFLGSWLRRRRTRRTAASFRVSEWRIVVAARWALQRVLTTARRDGWTESGISDALTLLRVLAAAALGAPIRQQVVPRGYVAQAGEWLLPRLSLRRPRILVCASTTATQLRVHVSTHELAGSLAAAIAACSDILYGHEESADARSRISADVEVALDASRVLLYARLLPGRRSAAGWRALGAA